MALDPVSMSMQATAQGWMNGINLIRSIRQRKQAKELEANNVRPEYTVPQEQLANQNLATQMAKQGLPTQQYNNALQNISQNATGALAQAQNRNSGLAAIGAIQQNTNQATNNLGAMDANARLSNIRSLMQQNNITSQYRNRAWDWNNRQKYIENAAAIRALKTSSKQNLDNAISGVFQGAAQMAGGGMGAGGVGSLTPQQIAEMNSLSGNRNWSQALPTYDFRIPR